MRTLKQRWAFERCFRNKGSVKGTRSILGQIARDRSTLQHEKEALSEVLVILDNMLNNWDDFPTQSWKLFERRSRTS